MLPLSRFADPSRFMMPAWQEYPNVTCRRGEDTRLTGFSVASNDIGLLHSEEMTDLGGPLSLAHEADGTLRLTNRTSHGLAASQVIRRTLAGRVETARPGRLDPGAAVVLDFGSSPANDVTPPAGEPSLRALVRRAADADDLRPGEVRLVATIDGGLPGLRVEPGAPESRRAALVVACLEDGPADAPRPDTNSPFSVRPDAKDAGR